LISFTPFENKILENESVARMATSDISGLISVVPICFAFDGEYIFTPIDNKPKKTKATKLKRVLNIIESSKATILVDKYEDDWKKLYYLMIRGEAEIIEHGELYEKSLNLLCLKYKQYVEMKLPELNLPVIIIKPVNKAFWKAS